ncbi:uncharacterized protein BP5553_06790 [Venustampulla echinocandica]|uniref:F-box domain-containing protein n=1 Tax=Venustampulla echinocandica TaxID=2656787 RepID=A0A370TKX8_9HELO|nr:uncharacterized protein BP5553_06790 [Venustampulla echinocandica]RDL36178.1 hypothetical protein BP5553_06790 [Venustampulla echinocandica]
MKVGNRGDYGMFGIEWDHNYYRARECQGYNDWEGGHGTEWCCADPAKVPNLTKFILSLLPQLRTPRPENFNVAKFQISGAETSTPKEASRFEALPVEITGQITSFLSTPSLLALRLSSKTLASRLCIDQQFWSTDTSVNDAPRDWKALAKQLAKKDDIMMAEGSLLASPIGFRNRCRIWRIIEEALSL